MNISALKYTAGTLVSQGKTKKVYEVKGNPGLAIIVSKDDITAGDGAKHDIMKGKAVLSNQTTCNVFRLLQLHGLPIAFIGQDTPNSFIAANCKMLPYEVVIRREAHGSYCKRHPHIPKGFRFKKLIAENFLKTKGKRWKGYQLECDDPFMYDTGSGMIQLFNPSKPMGNWEPFLRIPEMDIYSDPEEPLFFGCMWKIAEDAFLLLEQAWQKQGGILVDFKVEFGISREGSLLLADVIDNDSWRVLDKAGQNLDKQLYRDGGTTLEDIAERYKRVAEITGKFV